MMTTGYDCEDVLNVALARPIFSPTDFIQIKGRGTRLFNFKHGDGATQRTAIKDGYAIFDFFANCEYFEKKFDYDKKLSLPKGSAQEHEGEHGGGSAVSIEAFTNTSPDPIASVIRDEIGLFGMRIDREMYRERFAQQASEAVASDNDLRQAYDAEDWPAVEERVRRLLFEKPQEFWNLPKLQQIYKTDRLPSLREILARVFGLIPNIPTRGQLADEAFERFTTTQESNATHTRELRMVFVAFLLDAQSRMLLEEGRFAELRARDASLYRSLSQLSPQEREALIGYLQSQVRINEFEEVA
jgi:type I restriction enzyme R subunit